MLTANAGVDVALRLTLVAAVAYACYRVISPFVSVLLWTILLAVMVTPVHVRLRSRPGISNADSAVIIGVVGSLLILIPMALVTDSVIYSTLQIVGHVQEHGVTLPDRPAWIERIPLIGMRPREQWDAAANDLPSVLQRYREQIRDWANWLAGYAAGLAGGFFTGLLSVILASVLIAYGDEAQRFARTLTAGRGSRECHTATWRIIAVLDQRHASVGNSFIDCHRCIHLLIGRR